MKSKEHSRRRRFSLRELLKFLSIVSAITFVFTITFVQIQDIRAEEANTNLQIIDTNADFVYLSDLRAESTRVGWGSLGLDKASDGSKISMRVEDSIATFDKGIFAHATSELIYDIEGLGFDYFTSYIGLNKSSTSGNGVKFGIYTSNDRTDWELADSGLPAVTLPNTNATFVKVDIRGKKYLRLVAHDNGANGQDHSVYADAKLIKADYNDNVVRSVSEFDEEIQRLYTDSNGQMTDELELRILQRDLVRKVGQYQIRQLFAEGEAYQAAFNWVFENLDILRLYTMGGQPDGTYKMSFETLADLLTAHGEDLIVTGSTAAHGTPLSTVYAKMMITLALTHSRVVNFWVYGQPGYTGAPVGNISDPVWRYEIYKEQLLNNRLNNVFDILEIEEMRLVLSSQINDDEIKWARDYAVGVKGGAFGAYAYTPYRNVNTALYRQDAFYADDISTYRTKYHLTGYDVRTMPKYPRLWMVMEVGGVCWQLSNVGSNMVQAMGVPAILIGQPSHTAYLTYGINGRGQSVWAIQNNVGGWQVANIQAYNGTRGYFAQRLPISWGNGSYKRSNVTVSYVTLSAAALDDYDNFTKAETLVRLANSIPDLDGRIAVYREALEVQPLNFDAWLSLVQTYNADDTKTADERTGLAQEIAETLKFYPMPMSDLLRQIKTKITDAGHTAMMTRIEQDALNEALRVTSSDVAQTDITIAIARLLLGQLDTEVASFSFDGEHAGMLKLADRLTNAAFEYKLAGDDSWHMVDTTSIVLSAEELARISSDYGIKVHIVGMNYQDINIHSIAIQDGLVATNLYANDRENAVIGVNNDMEWQMDHTTTWTGYDVAKPDLTGNQGISVRYKASGTRLAGTSSHFTFSPDDDDPHYRYIPISNLSVYDYSSENIRPNRNEYEYATNAIDGNIHTYWHTLRTAVDPEKRLTVELAGDEYISRVEYVPVPNYVAGIIQTATLSFSTDGEHFERYSQIICDENYTSQSCSDGVSDTMYHPYDTRYDQQYFTLREPIKAKYVRVEFTSTWDSRANLTNNGFASIAMLNLFEDSTRSALPRLELHYNTHDLTNEDVTVQLVNPTPEEAVVFDNGDTYTFTHNGEYTFRYHNDTETGEIVARVDWIDKVAPEATVVYADAQIPINDAGDMVNGIKATISFSEYIEIINEDYQPIIDDGVLKGYEIGDGEKLILTEDGSLIHYLKFNHQFTIRFKDAVGNENSLEVKVDSLTVDNNVAPPDDTEDNGSENDDPEDDTPDDGNHGDNDLEDDNPEDNDPGDNDSEEDSGHNPSDPDDSSSEDNPSYNPSNPNRPNNPSTPNTPDPSHPSLNNPNPDNSNPSSPIYNGPYDPDHPDKSDGSNPNNTDNSDEFSNPASTPSDSEDIDLSGDTDGKNEISTINANLHEPNAADGGIENNTSRPDDSNKDNSDDNHSSDSTTDSQSNPDNPNSSDHSEAEAKTEAETAEPPNLIWPVAVASTVVIGGAAIAYFRPRRRRR